MTTLPHSGPATRRGFLAATASAASLVTAGRVFAAPEAADRRFLLVFLRGGYDATNIVAPTGDDFYYAARPTLALKRPDPSDPLAALPLDARFSLHPALGPSLYPLWQKRQVAFVPFAGTDDLSRSHFETQDILEMGQSATAAHDGTGFMSRLYGELAGARPIAFTDQLPLTFQGGAPVPNTGVASVGKLNVAPEDERLIRGMYRGRPLAASVDDGFTVREEVYHTLSAAEAAQASRGAVSAKGFELSARRIGRLMRTDYTLGFIDVGGWDTHVNEGGATGYLPDRIGELGRGLAAFVDEIGPDAFQKTTVVVVSEFGRTFHENGNRGADHGRGSVYWVLGGDLKGGRVAGPQVALNEATLVEKRDTPVLTDYRALIGGLLQRSYGLSPTRMDRIFPGVKPVDLALI